MTNRVLVPLLLLLLGSSGVLAQPTDESVRRLFKISKVEQQLEQLFRNVEASMSRDLQESFKDRSLTPSQRQALDQAASRFMAVFRAEVTLDQYERDYIALYREHLSQVEVDGLIAILSSPLGQTLTEKMPALAFKAMSDGQAKAIAILPRAKAAGAQVLREAGLIN